MLALEGYKERAVNNLLGAIESAKKTTLDRVFVGIGIPNVGKKTAKQLAKYIFNFAHEKSISVIEASCLVTAEGLVEIRDI